MNELSVNEFGGLDVRDDLGAWSEEGSRLNANVSLLNGKLFSRGGTEKLNTSSTNKDTLRGVFEYSGDNEEPKKVYCCSDTSSSVIQSGESGMAILKTGQYPDAFYEASEINGELFLVNGVNQMQQISGSQCVQAGMVAPTAAATFNSNINGNLDLSANYYFKYTYYNSALDKESNSSPASAVMTTGGTTATDGIKINIPANASLDSQVDAVRVYRTYGGETDIYYYDQEAAYSGTAITVDSTNEDSALDSTTVSPYAGATADIASDYSMPPIRQNVTSFGGVLWTMGTFVHSVGNVDVTNASANVGSGATSPEFDSDMVGATFYVSGDDREYVISSVTDADNIVLTENYEGVTGSDKTYYIYRDGSDLNYCLFENNVVKPNAFPTSNREYIREIPNIICCDVVNGYMLVMGKNRIHRISGSYGEWTNIVLSETHGIAGHMARCINGDGNMVFYTGTDIKVTDAASIQSYNTQPILRYIRDMINHDRDEYVHLQFDKAHNKVKMSFSSRGSTINDKVLEYHTIYGTWTLADIPSTCSGVLTDTTTGQTYVAYGDSYGFVHRDETGFNYSAGTSGTRAGTATGATSTTLTDSAATFNTTGDGLKGVRVYISYGTGEQQFATITSNTSTELTVDGWSGGVTPSTDSVYLIGAIDAYFYSKAFDFGDQTAFKRVLDCTITHRMGESQYVVFDVFKHLNDTGTVALTNGSATVTGTNTNFSEDYIGRPIRFGNDPEEYRITAVASSTSITLNRTYTGATDASALYSMSYYRRNIDTTSTTETKAFPHVRAKHVSFRIGCLVLDDEIKVYNYTARFKGSTWKTQS